MAQPTSQQRAAIDEFVAAWSAGEHLYREHPLVHALARTGVNDLRSSDGEMFLSSDGVSNRPLDFWNSACDRISFYANGVLVADEARRR